MLKCSTSLWSADLANLASEIRRVEPYSERFHLDVADGHYVKNLLFFPDQVKALRPHTRVPFEVHLMVTDPLDWIEPFVEAGADGFIFCFDSMQNPAAVLGATKAAGIMGMLSLDFICIFRPTSSLHSYHGSDVDAEGASTSYSSLCRTRRA